MDSFSLYIHIPYCERKCNYCDFVSFPKNEQNISNYVDNLIKEINMYKEKLSSLYLETIFIGGGTPSCIDSKYILRIINAVYENFNTSKLCEITIEANPGTLDTKKVGDYKEIGINRISLGLQSLNDNILKSIGRIHNAEDFYNSIKLLRTAGFTNINADIMFGLPNQSIEDLRDTISKVVDLGLEHISFYSLIIEEGTPLYNLNSKGLLQLPDEDSERLMYHKTKETLEEMGYIQYEISNFAKPGFKCNHNMTYWRVKPYLGVGLSSHSNLFGKRFWNYVEMSKYNEAIEKDILPVEDEEVIENDMEIAEYCILGLRLNEGILKNEFLKRFGFHIENKYKDIIILHKKNGLLFEDDNSIKLTAKGLDLANLVEVDFMP